MRLMHPRLFLSVLGVLLTSPLFLAADVAYAKGESITITSSSVTSEFPDGMRFKASVDSSAEVASVAVRLRIGQQTRGVYEYLKVLDDGPTSFELFWRTNSAPRYIPPGTVITYNFEVEDVDGNRFDSEQAEFIFNDIRFEWEEVSEGSVTLAYHGPVASRGRLILDAIIQTMENVAPVLGAEISDPIRVTMYNNNAEMLGALPPASPTLRRELITEGQAFTEIGTLILIGSGGLAEGTASHEVMHILTHRAGDSLVRRVPAWLNEGLSEWGNIQPGFSYEIALEFAVARDALMPITFMPALPGIPEEVIIFYGQARSIVRYMVGRYGPERMTRLMAALKSGADMDEALEEVYGFDRLGLANEWRDFLGAPAYVPPERGSLLPTPVPRREVLPYSLTPQAMSDTVATVESTPTPEPTAVPTATPEPVVASSLATDSTASATPEPETTDVQEADTEDNGAGGACSAPSSGSFAVRDVSSFGLVFGLIALGMRRRLRRP